MSIGSFWDIVVLGLASFRLTRLIVFDKIFEFIRAPFFDEVYEKNEDGEMEVFYMPKSKGIKKPIGELLSCYWCTGVWASIFVVLLHLFLPGTGNVVIMVLAVAAVGSIIETAVSRILGS